VGRKRAETVKENPTQNQYCNQIKIWNIAKGGSIPQNLKAETFLPTARARKNNKTRRFKRSPEDKSSRCRAMITEMFMISTVLIIRQTRREIRP